MAREPGERQFSMSRNAAQWKEWEKSCATASPPTVSSIGQAVSRRRSSLSATFLLSPASRRADTRFIASALDGSTAIEEPAAEAAVRAEGEMAGLTIELPDGSAPREIELAHELTTIGRGKANVVILLGDARVSLRHASIERAEQGWVLRDEGSTNGTWVNCQRVAEHLLADGDQIQIGDTVILFRDRSRAPRCR